MWLEGRAGPDVKGLRAYGRIWNSPYRQWQAIKKLLSRELI